MDNENKIDEKIFHMRFQNDNARWWCLRLEAQIKDFTAKLPPNMDLHCFATVNGIVVDVDDVAFWNPDMIMFIGQRRGGGFCRLCAHTSQISLVLEAEPQKANTPRKTIGFAPVEPTL